VEEATLKAGKGYHETRLAFDERREVLWKTLCKAFFQRLIPSDACVLELGAGYCNFINNIAAKRRFAVDMWDGVQRFAAAGVTTHVGDAADLGFVDDESVDFVFASNLVEHLSQADFARMLEQVRRKLKPGGTLNLLQPNYRFAYREYFDDYTHVAVYSDRTLVDYLESHGFQVIDCRSRFLPLTVKSRLPVMPSMIRLYLSLPFKPMGKQMLIRAKAE
jgi:SAM-dependent methyltransferase